MITDIVLIIVEFVTKTIKLSLALILCFSACIVCGEEVANPYEGVLELKKTLDVPNAFYSIHSFNPATYLEMFEEKDLVSLKDDSGKAKDPEKLRNLILEANKACYKKYKQTFLIDRRCSLFRMSEETFLDLKKLEGEPLGEQPNQSVFLSDVASILTKQ